MNKFILAIPLSLLTISVHGESELLQSTETKILFQTLTLLPKKITKLELPSTTKNTHGKIAIKIITDRELNTSFANRPTQDHVLFDGKEVGKFQLFIYTQKGHALTAKITDQEHDEVENQIVFVANLDDKNKESITSIGLVCDKKITILGVTWLDKFSK